MAKHTREQLAKAAREAGGPRIEADSSVEDLLGWMRWNEGGGPIAYDDELREDPTAEPPELDELWSELDDTLGDDVDDDDPEGFVLVKGRLVRR